jgi:hypothetical protein
VSWILGFAGILFLPYDLSVALDGDHTVIVLVKGSVFSIHYNNMMRTGQEYGVDLELHLLEHVLLGLGSAADSDGVPQ